MVFLPRVFLSNVRWAGAKIIANITPQKMAP